jgi:hypothetical protein
MQTYWIEEFPSSRSHGTPWWVFTNYEGTICSIPYHARSTAYYTKDYIDFVDYRAAWDEWIDFTIEQRRQYIREFRRNKNIYTTPFEARQAFAKQLMNSFVTFPTSMQACVTEPKRKKDEEMSTTEFTNERRKLRDVKYQAYHQKVESLAEEFHMEPYRATSIDEYITMVKAEQFDPIDEKTRMARISRYGNPSDYIVLRKYPKDEAGCRAARAKLDKEFADLDVTIEVTPTADTLMAAKAKVEFFRDHTCAVKPTVH